jgi:hypothetical protein
MRALIGIVAALALPAALGGCNPAGYPACYQAQCGRPPFQNSYAGYAPVYSPVGHPAFGELPFDDPTADYLWRGVSINPGAGNAQAANTALQTATPWPRHSNNTNIPGNGAQMTRAVHEFEGGTRETESAKRTFQSSSGSSGNSGITINNSGVGAAGAPASQ